MVVRGCLVGSSVLVLHEAEDVLSVFQENDVLVALVQDRILHGHALILARVGRVVHRGRSGYPEGQVARQDGVVSAVGDDSGRVGPQRGVAGGVGGSGVGSHHVHRDDDVRRRAGGRAWR